MFNENRFPLGICSTKNSTTIPLLSGATFTGTPESNQYADILIACSSDRSGKIYVDFSIDKGQTFYNYTSFDYDPANGICEYFVPSKGCKPFRIRYLNNSGLNQTSFNLSVESGSFTGRMNSSMVSSNKTSNWFKIPQV